MEKTGIGSFDLEKIMSKTVGSTQNAEKKPAGTPSWEDDSHAEEKGNKGKKRTQQ